VLDGAGVEVLDGAGVEVLDGAGVELLGGAGVEVLGVTEAVVLGGAGVEVLGTSDDGPSADALTAKTELTPRAKTLTAIANNGRIQNLTILGFVYHFGVVISLCDLEIRHISDYANPQPQWLQDEPFSGGLTPVEGGTRAAIPLWTARQPLDPGVLDRSFPVPGSRPHVPARGPWTRTVGGPALFQASQAVGRPQRRRPGGRPDPSHMIDPGSE
jgi:hypothetical protein